MDFEIILRIVFSLLLATHNLIQILLVNLIQSSLEVIPQALKYRGKNAITKQL